jgi:SanA protein
MIKTIWRITLNIVRGLVFFGLLILFAPRLITALYALTRIYDVGSAPAAKVAIVFGAGLLRDGTPTPVLRDRVATAADLYFNGKVEKLLMSGDNRSVHYNEPGAMKQYAVRLGVPEEAIALDFAGHRTYDTCYRAKAIFNVEQAILVTQHFHLPRALYTCQALGLPSVGVVADRREYRSLSLAFWTVRELFATVTAFFDVHITRPLPILGDPEPIIPIHSQ